MGERHEHTHTMKSGKQNAKRKIVHFARTTKANTKSNTHKYIRSQANTINRLNDDTVEFNQLETSFDCELSGTVPL